jgi:hypothetical protein
VGDFLIMGNSFETSNDEVERFLQSRACLSTPVGTNRFDGVSYGDGDAGADSEEERHRLSLVKSATAGRFLAHSGHHVPRRMLFVFASQVWPFEQRHVSLCWEFK